MSQNTTTMRFMSGLFTIEITLIFSSTQKPAATSKTTPSGHHGLDHHGKLTQPDLEFATPHIQHACEETKINVFSYNNLPQSN